MRFNHESPDQAAGDERPALVAALGVPIHETTSIIAATRADALRALSRILWDSSTGFDPRWVSRQARSEFGLPEEDVGWLAQFAPPPEERAWVITEQAGGAQLSWGTLMAAVADVEDEARIEQSLLFFPEMLGWFGVRHYREFYSIGFDCFSSVTSIWRAARFRARRNDIIDQERYSVRFADGGSVGVAARDASAVAMLAELTGLPILPVPELHSDTL